MSLLRFSAIISSLVILPFLIGTIGVSAKKTNISDIQFTEPISLQKVQEFSRANSIEVQELTYKKGSIQGGYTFQNNLSMQENITAFKRQHAKFLNVAQEKNIKDVPEFTDIKIISMKGHSVTGIKENSHVKSITNSHNTWPY